MDTATSNTGGGSAFASDSSTNLATVIKGLKKFDGKDPAEFKTWMKKFCVVLGVTRKDILPLLKKQRKPDPADTAAFDSYTRANEDLYAILFLLVELPAALSIQKHEDDTGISGDGQAAFEELCNNYDRVTDEVIRAKMEELENNPMNPGENPDDYFNQKHLLRTQLDKMGEPISDRRFKHICVQGFSDEYKDVKLMVFRDPTFNVLDMQSTMRNIFLDEQSRKGWKRTQSDPCVYVYTSGNIIVILTVYVDDILITGGDQQLVDQKKKELTDRFEMTDMGEVKRILGIDVQRDYEQGTLAISQEHYVNTLLERFGMQEANPVSTPGYGAEISTNQPQDQILGSTDKKIYQSMTGSILYLAQCTRFDLSYAALQLSKACSNPAQVNMTAAKHVLRYLRGNPVLPIVYKRGQFRLAAFTDSSFGANPDNGRSTTGYLFFLAGGPISYGAKTQTLTAQSTVEAEIQALSYSAREAVYISNFMTELNFKTFGSVPINSDSTGALTVAGNAMHSQRTKHVALRYFFIRELVLRGQITLHHRPSEHQLADIATKYLPKHRFASIIQQIKDFSC